MTQYPYSLESIEKILNGSKFARQKNKYKFDILRLIDTRYGGTNATRDWHNRKLSSTAREGWITQDQLEELAGQIGGDSELTSFAKSIAPTNLNIFEINLRYDEKNRAQGSEHGLIRLDGVRSPELIDAERWPKVASKLSIHIDEVIFEFHDGNKRGDYIVIQPAKGASGAVIIALDTESQEIALVKQYRYPTTQFLYELPRGFAGEGEQPSAVALRELLWETGLSPMEYEADGRTYLELFHLADLYTDSSILRTKPHFFLAHVNKQETKLGRKHGEPLHDIVIFVSVDRFYDLVMGREVQLVRDKDFTSFSDRAPNALDFRIEDAMTVNAALLAKPHIEAQLGREIALHRRSLRRTREAPDVLPG